VRNVIIGERRDQQVLLLQLLFGPKQNLAVEGVNE
jgi:hypothetical protein